MYITFLWVLSTDLEDKALKDFALYGLTGLQTKGGENGILFKRPLSSFSLQGELLEILSNLFLRYLNQILRDPFSPGHALVLDLKMNLAIGFTDLVHFVDTGSCRSRLLTCGFPGRLRLLVFTSLWLLSDFFTRSIVVCNLLPYLLRSCPGYVRWRTRWCVGPCLTKQILQIDDTELGSCPCRRKVHCCCFCYQHLDGGTHLLSAEVQPWVR